VGNCVDMSFAHFCHVMHKEKLWLLWKLHGINEKKQGKTLPWIIQNGSLILPYGIIFHVISNNVCTV